MREWQEASIYIQFGKYLAMEAATGSDWKKLPKMLATPIALSSWLASIWKIQGRFLLVDFFIWKINELGCFLFDPIFLCCPPAKYFKTT